MKIHISHHILRHGRHVRSHRDDHHSHRDHHTLGRHVLHSAISLSHLYNLTHLPE
jgi:hypothetical protein